ncbi:MAG: hypothetical protein EOO83_05800 [Oxalobacteraceae bacterium]|nr:MAG: hypothetical protein EOO83_05800 [Oxalobacteraceae bacterium]
MKLGLLPVALTLLVALSAPALACTPGPNQAEFDKAYYRSVTSVYRVVAEDFTPVDSRYPTDNFSVRMRPIEPIWGERPPPAVEMTFTAGMCSDWYIEHIEQGETLNGKEYLVFLAPAGQQDLRKLHVMPANESSAAEALVMLGVLQARGSGAPPPEDEGLPKWPPQGLADSAPTSSHLPLLFRWPMILGLGGFMFLIGLGVGRASLTIRKKSAK